MNRAVRLRSGFIVPLGCIGNGGLRWSRINGSGRVHSRRTRGDLPWCGLANLRNRLTLNIITVDIQQRAAERHYDAAGKRCGDFHQI